MVAMSLLKEIQMNERNESVKYYFNQLSTFEKIVLVLFILDAGFVLGLAMAIILTGPIV